MVAELADIAENQLLHNPFLGNYDIQRLKKQIAALPANAPAMQKFTLYFDLGIAEQFYGPEIDAVNHLAEAHRLLMGMPGRQEDSVYMLKFRLAIGYLRYGECLNLILEYNPDASFLPVYDTALHTDDGPARKGIDLFMEVLAKKDPMSDMHLGARWLLNIAYMSIGEYPEGVPSEYLIPPAAWESDEDIPRFRNISGRLGLDTFSLSGGAIGDDFDNDGYLDIVASTSDATGQMRLFINNADGTFTDRTDEANLTGILGGLNMLQADYDNDGDVDILVLRGAWFKQLGQHPNSLLRNNGDGTFCDVTFDAGLGDVHYPTQTADWGDYDNDGDLDLYIANESTDWQISISELFRNDGDGTFTDVTYEAGVDNDALSKGVSFGDYDNDGYVDLYVSNRGAANRLFHNNRDGTFTDVAPQLGVAGPKQSFPMWFWDYNNDGNLDIMVWAYSAGVSDAACFYLDMTSRGHNPRLFQGDGGTSFTDVAVQANLVQPTKPMGANFGDLDNDGFLDCYLGTGDTDYLQLIPNLMYRNVKGERFADVTTAGGFGMLQKGHGVIFADFDHDGDQDVFAQTGGAYHGDGFFDCLYENPGFGTHWISVKLVGVHSNRAGVGCRIKVDVIEEGSPRSIYMTVNSGGSFGGNSLRKEIGLGHASEIVKLEVFWPVTGATQVFTDVPMDSFLRITEGQDQFETVELQSFKLGGADPARD